MRALLYFSEPLPAMSFPHSISPDVDNAIEHVTGRFLDCAVETLERDDVDTVHDVYDALTEEMIDDSLSIGLDLDERLSLAEEYADDYGLELGEVTINDLRARIEILAVLVLHQLGLERAHQHLSVLENTMSDHGLTLSQLRSDNPHGWARHWAERDEEHFQVYEYRNLEGEQIHVDLWEYLDLPGYHFYFEVWLDPDDVSAAESRFDAS